MDNGLYTGMVMIDLHKAFDTINHSLLSDKLQALGLNNVSVSWFDSYLTNQTQKVDINGTFSKPRMGTMLQITCCFRGVAKPSNSLGLKKSYNKADYVSMREKVKKVLNKDTSSDLTVGEKWNRPKEAIQTAEAKYTPVRPHNPLADNSKRSTPLENKTVKLIRKKHRLCSRYMETRDKKYHQKFCKIRNKGKSLTRQAKLEYEKSIAIQAKSRNSGIMHDRKQKSRQV